MRVLVGSGAAAALLAGCAEPELSRAERAAMEERAIAEVEAAQTPPPDVVAPQRITQEEQARYQLGDGGCSFTVNNPQLGAHAILKMNVGYMKFDGAMERFASDAGSGGGPAGTSTRYDGGRHALAVQYQLERAERGAGDLVSVPARITLKDGRARTVYVAEGLAVCG